MSQFEKIILIIVFLASISFSCNKAKKSLPKNNSHVLIEHKDKFYDFEDENGVEVLRLDSSGLIINE